MTDPLALVLGAVVVFIAFLFAVEIWAIKSGRPTISARFQDLNRMMSKQLIAGIMFLLGGVTLWFVAHFTSFC